MAEQLEPSTRITLGEIHRAVVELKSLVERHIARQEERTARLEEADQDKEIRLRLLEREAVTRAELGALRGELETRQGRAPAWVAVVISAIGLVLSAVVGVATLMQGRGG
ncbi:hypothetical protein [Carbonactinospora thermoautotrophica]|nr:hypothetical protein [Carbonactinospora thermoautotrophica]